MWNVHEFRYTDWIMYGCMLIAFGFFFYGMYKRVQFWSAGKSDDERFSDWFKRLWILIREAFLQKQVRNSTFPAIFHSFIFYSFIFMAMTTALLTVLIDLPKLNPSWDFKSFFSGWVYIFFHGGSTIAGLLVLVGVGMAAWRRYIKKPETLETTWADGAVLLQIALIIITGFFAQALRIQGTNNQFYQGLPLEDQFKWVSPVGWALSGMFSGVSIHGLRSIHSFFWFFHMALAMSFIAVIPYTKFVHILSLPTNQFFSKLKARGELIHEDMEKLMEQADENGMFPIGVMKAEEFKWKQRLDFDACIKCGRCEEICPAYMVDKTKFSPRRFIAKMKEEIYNLQKSKKNGETPSSEEVDTIIGKALDEEFIWHCRTCTACMEVCPALIEHVDTIMELRRNEVLIQGRMPPDAARALKMLGSLGNPFGPQSDRVDWVNSMNVRVVKPGEKCDVIYWIGCCATFDPQKQKIAKDLCRLMQICGIDFGVLGPDEKCCGDPARVIGEENLFQTIAKETVEALKSRDFKVLMTSCPHCYNVLKHEYKQFGGDFNVVHHSEFMHEMLWAGHITPKLGAERKIVYHDPCYLGRYQKIYDSPREVIKAIPGSHLMEMENHRHESMCCGGGGGHYWMDLKCGERINNLRVAQAHKVGADTIVTGCSYCLHMLEDSVKLLNYDDHLKVVDIGTLVLDSIEKRKTKAELEAEAAAAAATKA
jgi:Fe-S oxidoreductase/nitrate reductase gamma subunit